MTPAGKVFLCVFLSLAARIGAKPKWSLIEVEDNKDYQNKGDYHHHKDVFNQDYDDGITSDPKALNNPESATGDYQDYQNQDYSLSDEDEEKRKAAREKLCGKDHENYSEDVKDIMCAKDIPEDTIEMSSDEFDRFYNSLSDLYKESMDDTSEEDQKTFANGLFTLAGGDIDKVIEAQEVLQEITDELK